MSNPDAQPLVAVVTPVYNGAAYLAEALESVQEQSYPNIVHVILDNASTDATAAIIASFQNKRVPVVTARNPSLLPMHDNWNAALRMVPSDAAFFRILCADDAMMPEHLSRAVALAQSDPEIAVVCTQFRYNAWEQDFAWPRDRNVYDGRFALQNYFVAKDYRIEARQALMRVSAINQHRPFFDPEARSLTDLEAVVRQLSGGKFGMVHEPLEMIRIHEASITDAQIRPLHLQFIDWFYVFKRHGRSIFGDVEYERVERRFRRYYTVKLLQWRFLQGNRRAFDIHMQNLQRTDRRPTLFDYADAAIDYLLKRAGLRPGWATYPT